MARQKNDSAKKGKAAFEEAIRDQALHLTRSLRFVRPDPEMLAVGIR